MVRIGEEVERYASVRGWVGRPGGETGKGEARGGKQGEMTDEKSFGESAAECVER